MNIPRRLIGRHVTITWVDPRALRLTSYFPNDHRDVPHGKAGLAIWEEDGFVEKIEDEVLYLRQGLCTDPPGEGRQQHEIQYSVVHVALIESIRVWSEEPSEEVKDEKK